MASSVSNDNSQVRTSSSGLKFGPEWMRNPPRAEESFPQRQFALAQYRYGREEMLQIFEQIAAKQSEMAPPDELTQVPPDFPDMVDTFQYPVAYQSPINERRPNEQDNIRRGSDSVFQNNTELNVGASSLGRGGGRGRGNFAPLRNGWNEPRNRQRSDQDDDWRKPVASEIGGDSGKAGTWDSGTKESLSSGWNRAGQNRNRPTSGGNVENNGNGAQRNNFWPQSGGGNSANRNDRWNNNVPPKRMPEWLDSEPNVGVFADGNFTDTPGGALGQHAPITADNDKLDDTGSELGSKKSELSQSESETQSPAPDLKQSPGRIATAPGGGQSASFDKGDTGGDESFRAVAANVDERAEPVLKAHDSSVADASVAYAPPTQQMPIQGHMMMQPPPMSQPPPLVNQPWFEAMTMDWFYKDPNGQIQGPFSSRDMGEWSDLGYFKDDLLIRRHVDQQFMPLGQVQGRYQCDPFRSLRHPPALVNQPPPVQPQQPPMMNRQPPGMGGQPTQQRFVQQQNLPGVAASGGATANQAPPPPAPRLSPIEEVVHLIQTSVQHQAVFKQLMIQITQLEQYKDLPHQHQEQLVLQHMAAMFRIQPQQQQQQPPPTQQQPQHPQQQQPPVSMQQHQAQQNQQQQHSQQAQLEKEAEMQRELEEQRRKEKEKLEKERHEELIKEKQREIERELKRQEEELAAKQEALLQQERQIQQQKEQFERDEQKRLAELRKAEEMRKVEEARIKSAQEEALKKLEMAERLKREEEARLAELERLRQEEEHRQQQMQEENIRHQQAQMLIEKAEQERLRKEKEKETEERRRKKEEEKRVREKNKADAERKKREQEEMAKLQEQLKAERAKETKKENEEKERKAKANQKAAEKARQAAPKWNTNVAAQPMSFKELQMADQEEMKKIEKQNQIELERKKADARAAAESRNQTGWAGLLRQGPVVPVSPVVAPRTTKKEPPFAKKASKPSNGKQKSKDELGFWDSAVDAVLTDKTAVSSRMTQQPISKGPESEKAHVRQLFEKLKMEDPLLSWARTELETIPNSQEVDIPTFVGFLRDLENDYEVEDYARMYFGTGKGVLQFAQKFVEMRKKFKNEGGGGVAGQKKANKKNRKNKNKANPDLLGFTPTAGDQRNREGQLEGAKS